MLNFNEIKFITLIIIFLLSNNVQAQIQSEFFVDDAVKVDVLTLNFCVNNEGKTISAKVVPEKTSYRNLENIDKVIEYFKGVEYYPESSFSNNCQDYNFKFINTKYQDKHLDSLDFKLCEKLKTGIFNYDNVLYPNTIIERTNNLQIEKSGNDTFKYKIEWPNPNRYILTYVEVSDKQYDYLIGEKINVEIIDVLENGEYIYRSELLNRTFLTGIIRKIK